LKSCCSGSAGQSFDTAAAFANQGPGIVYEARDDRSNCVGGSGPTCTGGTLFPLAFDTTPGGITAPANTGPSPATPCQPCWAQAFARSSSEVPARHRRSTGARETGRDSLRVAARAGRPGCGKLGHQPATTTQAVGERRFTGTVPT